MPAARRRVFFLFWSAMLLAAGFGLARMTPWLPIPSIPTASNSSEPEAGEDAHNHQEGEGHDHAHGDEELPNDIALSDQARENLQLRTGPVETGDFWRTITIPAEVMENQGHSESRITAAVNGLIMKVHVLPGQLVSPGDDLFDIQTTGDLLANSQSSLLKIIQELDLVETELQRLKPLSEQGAVPGVRYLEKQYEKQRLDIQRQVQIQELLVRGISLAQIDEIIKTKVLLRQFTVVVPGGADKGPASATTNAKANPRLVLPVSYRQSEENKAEEGNKTEGVQYSVEKINVFPGKFVQTGEELCDLALHTNLRLAGMSFQSESEIISRVFEERRPIRAVFDIEGTGTLNRIDLQIEFVENTVDTTTGLFRFFIPLKNEVLRDVEGENGVKFRVWRFKPGQRARLLVPAEEWKDQIVVPQEAVVREGPDAFMFRANGKLFERVPVTVRYEDPRRVVVADDGSLFPGDEVALNGAYQLNLALKKQQGSGVDPHAGHNH